MSQPEDPFTTFTKSRLAWLIAVDAAAKNFSDYPPGGLLKPELLASDYVAPSRASEVLVTALVLGPLAAAVVCLRLVVVNRWPGVSMGAEDWMIILASLCMAGLIAVQVDSGLHSVGKHLYDALPDDVKLNHLLSQPNLQLYAWAMYFSKLSNLFFTRRITPKHMRKTHIIIYVFFAFHTVWTLLATCLVFFGCIPVRAQWDLEFNLTHKLKCFHGPQLAMAASTLFVSGDVAFMILPVILVAQLELPRRTKIGVALLFALGAFVCVTSMVKIKYFVHYYSSWDTTWNCVNVIKWSTIEVCFSLIIVSLPALDMLLVRLVPRPLLEKMRAADAKETDNSSFDAYPSAAKVEFATYLDPRNRDPKEIAEILKANYNETSNLDLQLQHWAETDVESSTDQRSTPRPTKAQEAAAKPMEDRKTVAKPPMAHRNSISWLSIESDGLD